MNSQLLLIFILGHIDDYNDVVLFESGFIDRCDGWGFAGQVSHSLNLPDGLFLEMTLDVIANVYFDGAPVRIGDSFVIPNDDRRIRVGFGSVYDESRGYPECVLSAECEFTLRIKGEVQDKSLQKYDCHYYIGVYNKYYIFLEYFIQYQMKMNVVLITLNNITLWLLNQFSFYSRDRWLQTNC